MLNIRMKKKQAIIFIVLILALFILNGIFMHVNKIEVSEMPEMIDHDHISSQKLFDNSWKIIRDNYYDENLNNQALYSQSLDNLSIKLYTCIQLSKNQILSKIEKNVSLST